MTPYLFIFFSDQLFLWTFFHDNSNHPVTFRQQKVTVVVRVGGIRSRMDSSLQVGCWLYCGTSCAFTSHEAIPKSFARGNWAEGLSCKMRLTWHQNLGSCVDRKSSPNFFRRMLVGLVVVYVTFLLEKITWKYHPYHWLRAFSDFVQEVWQETLVPHANSRFVTGSLHLIVISFYWNWSKNG